MADRVKGGDQEGRLGPRAGILKRKLPNCQRQKRYSRTAWAASTHCEGKGPENPGVVAPLADAGCRGNRSYDYMAVLNRIRLLTLAWGFTCFMVNDVVATLIVDIGSCVHSWFYW